MTLLLLLGGLGPPALAEADRCRLGVGVVDETGAPAPAGIVVRVVAGDDEVRRDWPGGTDAIVFDDVPCGGVRVEAGYRRNWEPFEIFASLASAEVALAPGTPGNAVLRVPALRSVYVRVRDRDGRAVPGVLLLMVPRTPLEDRTGTTMARSTGADGGFTTVLTAKETYEIKEPTAWRDQDVTATVDGRAVERPVILPVSDRAVEIAYVVPVDFRVTGVVVDDTGRGVPGVFPRVTSESGSTSTRPTDPDGSFVLTVERLPVEFKMTDLVNSAWEFDPATVRVTAENLDRPVRVVARRREGGDLTVRVTAAGTGDPVADARVTSLASACVDPTASVVTRERRTGPDGTVALPCEPCSYRIRVDPPPGSRWMRNTWTGDIRACDDELALQLVRGAVLAGSVADPRGEPVAGLDLDVHLVGGGLGRTRRTDEDGRFEAGGLIPGTWQVELSRYRSPEAGRDRVLVRRDARAGTAEALDPSATIESLDEDAEIDLRLVPGGRVCLAIADPDGNPVEVGELGIYLRDREEPLFRTAQSRLVEEPTASPERLCSMPLAAGDYLVRAGAASRAALSYVPAWWPGEERRELATPVAAEPGKTVEIGPMIVTPAGSLRLEIPGAPSSPEPGRLRFELLRRPAPDADATASDETPRWSAVPADRVRIVSPRSDGDAPPSLRLSVRWIPVGSWDARLCVRTDDDAGQPSVPRCWVNRAPIAVHAGETVDVPFEADATSDAPELAAGDPGK